MFKPIIWSKRLWKLRCFGVLHTIPKRSNVTTSVDDDGLFYISINRPARRNAVDLETASQLYDAFNQFNDSKKSKIGIFHSTGGFFCGGFDLTELSKFGGKTNEEIQEHLERRGPMGPSRMHFNKPIIAAVAGYAVAGGLELALLCDMRILEEDAILGVFCRRFGVPLIDGGTVRLPKMIGLSRALDIILTGRAVTALEAFDIGLANRIVPKGASLEAAKALAKQLLKFPEECMLADRESTYHSLFQADSIEEALKFEYQNGMKVLKKESVPGASQFLAGKGKSGTFD